MSAGASHSAQRSRARFSNREQIKMVLVKMAGRKTLAPSELYHLLHPLSVESLISLMAKVTRREAQKAISTFLTHLRHTTIETRGEDLKMLGFAPGRLYKKILDSLLDARLDGRVQTKSEEMEYVRAHFMGSAASW